MNNKPIITVENISFSYVKNSEVLSGVGFSVLPGTTTMLIGPNGSGKTTLLKIMIGLLRPTSGSVSILGSEPKNQRDAIGYVPQKLQFDTSFPVTVVEFLKFSHKNITTKQIVSSLENLDIGDLADSLIGELSGGQLQRILIARSLLSDPEILFLDEPASGIDIGGEYNFYELIKKIQKERKMTVIMVSHEVHLVSRIADQVICVNREMLCSGKPAEALLPEVMEKLYGKDVSLYEHNC